MDDSIDPPSAFVLARCLYNNINAEYDDDITYDADYRVGCLFKVAQVLFGDSDLNSIDDMDKITPQELVSIVQILKSPKNDAFQNEFLQQMLTITKTTVDKLIRMDAARANASDATNVSNETTGSSNKRRRID